VDEITAHKIITYLAALHGNAHVVINRDDLERVANVVQLTVTVTTVRPNEIHLHLRPRQPTWLDPNIPRDQQGDIRSIVARRALDPGPEGAASGSGGPGPS
jgi:hypothetical protein